MSLICKKTVEERLEELETRIIELEKLLVKGKRGPPLKKHINSNNITIKEKIFKISKQEYLSQDYRFQN